MQILSWYPRIVLYPNFLDTQTTDHIRRLAAPQLEKSELGVGSVATGAAGQEVSDGSLTFCQLAEHFETELSAAINTWSCDQIQCLMEDATEILLFCNQLKALQSGPAPQQ